MAIEFICIIGIFLLLISSQTIIEGVYRKYSRAKANLEYTGKDIAERMLYEKGINDVNFGLTKGTLTDYYNPKSKSIYLSKNSCTENSVASIAVAAHETGHAIQDAEGYFMLKVRKVLAPVCSFSSKFVWVFIIIGIILAWFDLILVGLALMAITIIFQLVTLPVEFDASRRAIEYVSTLGYNEETMLGVRKMLKAAAYTYVASTMAAILQFIRLFVNVKRD